MRFMKNPSVQGGPKRPGGTLMLMRDPSVPGGPKSPGGTLRFMRDPRFPEVTLPHPYVPPPQVRASTNHRRRGPC